MGTLDRQRYSFLAHHSMAFANPLSFAAIDQCIDLLPVGRASSALDIGCGKAEWLIRLAEQKQVSGIGVDNSALVHGCATVRAKERNVSDRIWLHCQDAESFVTAQKLGSFDVVSCLGSSHALGSAGPTLDCMVRLCKPGGHVVLGEAFWAQKPDAGYLEALGGTDKDLGSHRDNVTLGTGRSLIARGAWVASAADWDAYEWAYARNIEDYCTEHPDDADRDAMLERSRTWRTTYLTWGRETLGFGLYLFRKPL
jgi:SAM-dependent methyltransferase